MWVTFSAKPRKIIHILFRYTKKNDKFDLIINTKNGQPIPVQDKTDRKQRKLDKNIARQI